jgi:D-alanine--poly(phosphoribitol) ligase subunit 1
MSSSVYAGDNVARFMQQSANSPNAIAVIDGSRTWSYQDIAEQATGLSRLLRRSGIPEGSLIALSVGRGWRAIVAVLAIWLHGCAYVPIDPDYPAKRRAYMTEDSRVSYVVRGDEEAGFSVESLPQAVAPHFLPAGSAYVIYTSGSTGAPKGAIIQHANVQALLDGARAVIPVSASDVGTIFHSYCFDFSVWETWRLLTVGGCCVCVPKEITLDANRFIELLSSRYVSILNLVPSVFANMVRALGRRPAALPSLREVIFGGEPLAVGAVREWYNLGLAPAAELINMYGITETTVHVTAKRLQRQEMMGPAGDTTPIGRPLPHLEVRVLDDSKPVGSHVTGEMYISGDALSHGYLGRPELTAERFIRLADDPAQKLWYRTGDLARFDDDGELFFVGRKDDQIQLRGYRIEPGEINAVLCRLPGVADGAALVVPNRQGEPTLVACYVPATGQEAGDAAALRAALRETLPPYMVPVMLLPVAELPVTPEGKLDKAALAETVRASSLGRR